MASTWRSARFVAFASFIMGLATASTEESCASESCKNKETDENVELQIHSMSDSDDDGDYVSELLDMGYMYTDVLGGESGDPGIPYPFEVIKCKGGDSVLTTASMTLADYAKILNQYSEIFNGMDQACEGMTCPVAQVSGCILRMGGHDFMDYHTGIGGSDGCIDFHDHDNKGLDTCLLQGDVAEKIYGRNGIYQQWCKQISLADWWVISAEAAMNHTRQLYIDAFPERNPQRVDFQSQFRYGRTTNTTCPQNAPLPNASASCTAVEQTYVTQMKLTWKQAAALSGVHTLGKAQPQNSGFDGWWSTNEESRYFNNNYFVSLYAKGWIPEQVKESGKWQWRMADKTRDVAKYGKQMMLDTDLCLAYSQTFATTGYVEVASWMNPKTCAWTIPNLSANPQGGDNRPNYQVPLLEGADKYNNGKWCSEVLTEMERNLPGGHGKSDRLVQWKGWYADMYNDKKAALNTFSVMRGNCCIGCANFNAKCPGKAEAAGMAPPAKDLGVVTHPSGRAAIHVMEFMNDETVWLDTFMGAWRKATTNGECCKKLRRPQ